LISAINSMYATATTTKSSRRPIAQGPLLASDHLILNQDTEGIKKHLFGDLKREAMFSQIDAIFFLVR